MMNDIKDERLMRIVNIDHHHHSFFFIPPLSFYYFFTHVVDIFWGRAARRPFYVNPNSVSLKGTQTCDQGAQRQTGLQ
jgi:hypothetical protein